jgi:hypothetical protein
MSHISFRAQTIHVNYLLACAQHDLIIFATYYPEQLRIGFVPFHKVAGGISRHIVDFCIMNREMVPGALLGKAHENTRKDRKRRLAP